MGKVDVDDFCHILAKMEDGVSGVFEVSRFASSRDHQRLEIYGKKGALIYTNYGLIKCGLEASIGFRPFGQLRVAHSRLSPSAIQSLLDRLAGW